MWEILGRVGGDESEETGRCSSPLTKEETRSCVGRVNTVCSAKWHEYTVLQPVTGVKMFPEIIGTPIFQLIYEPFLIHKLFPINLQRLWFSSCFTVTPFDMFLC